VTPHDPLTSGQDSDEFSTERQSHSSPDADETEALAVNHLREHRWVVERGAVPREEPLTLHVNDKELVTLMASPGGWTALAVGFLFGEGIISELGQIDQLEEEATGIRVTARGVDIGMRLFERRVLSSGCGKATGFVTALDALAAPTRTLPAELPWVAASTIERAALATYSGGELYKRTQGTHAAGLFARDGSRVGLAEDIGRHNAVDRVIGEQVLSGGALEEHFMVVTGRISSDMATKAARTGMRLVASKSVATTLAVEYARRLSLGLVGRVARGRLTAYNFPELIDPAG
jgi:FdhD protein